MNQDQVITNIDDIDSCRSCQEECCIIDIECVVNKTPLTTDVDSNEIYKCIHLAQLCVKNELIGVCCFNKLCEDLSKDEDERSESLKKLQSIIVDFLSWKTYIYWMMFFSDMKLRDFAISDKGRNTQNSKGSGVSTASKSVIDAKISRATSLLEDFKSSAEKMIVMLDLDCMPKIEHQNTCSDDTDDFLDVEIC